MQQTLLTKIKALLPLFKKHTLLVVIVPWVVYALYITLIASPQYISRSQLIVKSSDGGSSFDPSSLLSSVGATAGGNNSQLIEAFVKSRDMLNYLDNTIQLRDHFIHDGADMFSRLSSSASQEDFLDYYLSHVEVSVDSASSVITVQSRAFSRDYAQLINETIVKHAEHFINDIGNNLAKSKLEFAKGEHAIVEQKLQDAKTQLLAFQSKYNVLDPTAEGAAFQQIAFSMEATLAQKKAEFNTLSTMMSESAPEIINLKRQINALQAQILEQKEKINTADDGINKLSVSELMSRYSNLQVQVELALQAYSSSLVTLENARVDAYQQLEHLVTVESPTLPDESLYPKVVYNLVLFAVVLLMLYGIVRIIIATIKEL